MSQLPDAKAQALRAIPGADVLIETFADSPGVYLVGGAVRDLMLGFAQFDLDVMVEGSAAEAAAKLAARVPGKVNEHERFLTANYEADDGSLKVDFATARTETYDHPGALPTVTASDAETDLARRDFSINAMALPLWTDAFGEILEYSDAGADLLARVLRVTHDESFRDDPTRLLRLLRYGARLGFTAEPHTEELARAAVEAGAAATVSGARVRDELIDLLKERSAVVAVESMYALGLDRALHESFDADEYLVARAMNEPPSGARQELLLLAICSRGMEPETLAAWLEHLNLPRRDRAVVTEAVARGPLLLGELAEMTQDGAREDLVKDLTTETLLFALAIPRGDADAAEFVRGELARRSGPPETA
jgi:tRNA nucleotidyltransferase (CCA-adding enzyme)